jgi:hypothetical protein
MPRPARTTRASFIGDLYAKSRPDAIYRRWAAHRHTMWAFTTRRRSLAPRDDARAVGSQGQGAAWQTEDGRKDIRTRNGGAGKIYNDMKVDLALKQIRSLLASSR